MSEYTKLENAKAKLQCTLEGDIWQKAKETAFKKLAAKVEIKGFRKGQAPKNLVEKYVSKQEILLDAAESLAQEALNNAIDEHQLTLIDRPSLGIDEMNEDKCVLSFTCPVYPDVNVKDYQKLKFEVEDVKVEDSDVDEAIAGVLNRKADLELKEDGEVEDGDTAVIDYEGFVDDVAFEGGKDENHELVIGSHSFIPGFEEQLIGMKSEETKDILVTFPEDYHAEHLKGKEAKFVVTVHEIKKKVLPELNDEFIQELKIDDVDTVDKYREYIKDNLTKNKEDAANREAENKLVEALTEIVEVDIPEVMIESEKNQLVQQYEQQMMQSGFGLQQYLQMINQDINQFKDTLTDQAVQRIKTFLGLKEIAKLENIEVNDEDLDKEYENMAKMYSMEVDEIKKFVPKDTLSEDLLGQKTLEFLKNK